MTVIYSNFNDPDTRVLRRMWRGLDNVTLVTNGTEEKIRKALTEEKDTLLFCGHGTATGLWMPHKNIRNPYFPFAYAFSEKDIPFIKAENIIGIWCYASQFAQRCNLRGFYTSMFISSPYEAELMGVKALPEDEITRSEELFCDRINKLLKDNVPLSGWKERLQGETLNNDVERFNYNGLTYRS